MDYKDLAEMIEISPLLAVDKIIIDYSGAKFEFEERDFERLRNYFTNSVLKHLQIEIDRDNNMLKLFCNEYSDMQQRFISVCLLRLLHANDKLFSSNDAFRNKTFTLFDNIFEKPIYQQKDVALTAQSQGYMKESKLKMYLETNEKHIKDNFSISSLNNINAFENKFYKNIFSDSFKLLFFPFLPENLIHRDKYTIIFKSINEYLNNRDKIKYYNNVQDGIEQYIQEANAYSTYYCNEFLVEPFERILNLIKKDFEENPSSKPAKITLIQSEKKYPFNVIGSKFRVSSFLKNEGTGHSFNTEMGIKEYENSSISFIKTKRHIGEISDKTMLVEFDCEVLVPQSNQTIIFTISWENFDNTKSSKEYIFEFEGQNLNVNWDELQNEEPYSWEPVESEGKLFGRKEIIDRLWTSIIKKDKMSSFYIFGQKRVGKTSIVKTLKSKLDKDFSDSCIVLYLEGGEYKDLELSKTITSLGKLICTKICDYDLKFKNVSIPEFSGALSPLTRFLDSIAIISPKVKILFILDEFDEISSDIFLRGEISNSLFLTIRAISNKNNFGFLLVGGEKMDFIISSHGEQLNKFQSIRVDYFDKDKYLNDFHDLARKPVENILEFTDQSLDYLYNQTSGNPFFTTIVCAKLFSLMVSKRDCHVTDIEMKEAISNVIEENDTQIFAHFWEDRIKGKPDEEEGISILRRKIIISIAQVLILNSEAEKNQLLDENNKNGITTNETLEYLKEFVERKILINHENNYVFVLNIFKDWLTNKGINCIITTFSDKEIHIQEELAKEKDMVKPEEIIQLLESWSNFTYDGKQITTDSIRAWLNQFGNNRKQRLMFKILKSMTVYTDYNIKQKMKEIYRYMISKENLVWEIEGRKRKRSDILVSYLENNFSKSGIEYARLFTDQNDILVSNVVERNKVASVLNQKDSDIKALVFIDDFIGTGGSICDNLNEFINEFPDIKTLNVKIFIGIVTGFLDGKDAIMDLSEKIGLKLEVFICNPLHDENKCFHHNSNVFTSTNERMMAEDISNEHGVKLVRKNPNGFGNCQAIVVFPNTCPNDSLPILWASNKEFNALFPRKT